MAVATPTATRTPQALISSATRECDLFEYDFEAVSALDTFTTSFGSGIVKFALTDIDSGVTANAVESSGVFTFGASASADFTLMIWVKR